MHRWTDGIDELVSDFQCANSRLTLRMSQKEIYWITGAQGLIGNLLMQRIPDCIQNQIKAGQAEVIGLTRETLDLNDFGAIAELWESAPPTCVIHTAALSRVGDCNQNPDLAFRINTDLPGHLAQLCQESGARLVFFSTDLVFDGLKTEPYVETDELKPVHVYAESKARAEDQVRGCDNHLILRTSLNAGRNASRNSGFVEEMKAAWTAGRTLDLFVDEYRCPIPASVTADGVWDLAQQDCRGTLHWVGSQLMSRFEIGATVAACFPGLRPTVRAGTLREYSGPPRCPHLNLDISRVSKLISFQIPRFQDWVKENQSELVDVV